MSFSFKPDSQAKHDAEDHFSESLIRQKLVQRVCGQAVMYFGALIVIVSLVKFVSAFSQEGSPFSELQLGLAGLLLVVAGRLLGRSNFLKSLLSEFNASARASRSLFVFGLAAIIVAIILIFKLSVQDVLRYKRLLGEGGILEYLQALTLFTSAWVSLLVSRDLWQRLSMRLHGFIYAVIALALLFVGLEELAWGQVLFSWNTPANIASLNAQNQTTFHNLEFFQDYLDMNLFLVSLLTLLLVICRPSFGILRKKFNLGDVPPPGIFFLPRYFWPLFFCATFLSYFVANKLATDLVLNIDQEWAEFILYLSVAMGLLRTYILLGHQPMRQLG